MIIRWDSPFRLFAAIGRALWFLVLGRPVITPPGIRAVREEICDGCTENTREATPQCRACTCFIEIKVLGSAESCPRGYWKRLTFARKIPKTGDEP